MAGLVLTARQQQILACIHEGLSNKAIAHTLGISEGTVKTHVTALMRRLGVRSRVEAAFVPPSQQPG